MIEGPDGDESGASVADRVTDPLPVRQLRIAILGSRGYPSTYGGFETFVRVIAPWLVSRGHHVTVFGRDRRSGPASAALDDGVHVVNTRGLESKSTSTLTHGLTAWWHVGRHRPDVVLAMNVATGFGLPLARIRSVPVVMNVDGIEWDRPKWGAAAKTVFRAGAWLSARLAAQLVADSQEIARIWEARYGTRPAFIPYGAEVRAGIGIVRVKDLGLKPGTFALAVARLAPENNVELLLDGMAQQGWPAPVVVVGAANYENPLEERLRTLQERGVVRWLGHVSDQELLAQLWANAGAYFHGHSVGGTNPALLQALGLGAPTVAVDTVFNREVLGDGGVLVPAEPGAVGEAVTGLLGDDDRRATLAANGREIVATRYQWQGVLLAYEQAMIQSVQDSRHG